MTVCRSKDSSDKCPNSFDSFALNNQRGIGVCLAKIGKNKQTKRE